MTIKREGKGEEKSQLTGNKLRNGNRLLNFDVKLVGGAINARTTTIFILSWRILS